MPFYGKYIFLLNLMASEVLFVIWSLSAESEITSWIKHCYIADQWRGALLFTTYILMLLILVRTYSSNEVKIDRSLVRGTLCLRLFYYLVEMNTNARCCRRSAELLPTLVWTCTNIKLNTCCSKRDMILKMIISSVSRPSANVQSG